MGGGSGAVSSIRKTGEGDDSPLRWGRRGGGDGCRVRVSPRTDTCQNDLTTGTEDGRAFPQVVEPLRGQSRTKLSWRIIVPRGVSRAAVQGASDPEHASKRGSDGSVSLPCAAVHHDPPRSTSVDRSIDRSTYRSIHLRIGRPVKPVPPSPPPLSLRFANCNHFFISRLLITLSQRDATIGSVPLLNKV